MRQIVCLSTSNYHPYPTRKQNIMNRLHDAEIIYFDPPISRIAPLKDKSLKPRLNKFRKPGEKVQDNITVYALPPVWPLGNKYRFINRLNQRRQACFIRTKLAEHGFSKPSLWCYSPTAADILPYLEYHGLIYDCVDRHSAYKGLINPVIVDAMECDLAKTADMVFSTAIGLHETLSQYNSEAMMIPNGAAFELFNQAADAEGYQRPHDKKPVFGFVGMLQDCIAYDYLLALADAMPDGEIQLIGRVMPGVDVSKLVTQSNIKLLGLLPQQELPDIMRNFDVCLNIFSPGLLAKDVSPLKFYEYLATGKPIVSTEEPLQVRGYADIIYIANSKEEFVRLCKDALAENDNDLRLRRIEAGQAANWDNRVKQIEEILVRKGILS